MSEQHLHSSVQGQDVQGSHHHHHHHNHHHHHHDHQHGHDHQAAHGENPFNGKTYWRWPGVRETGMKTAATFGWAMSQAGVSADALSGLHLLEVGCGGGAATPHLAPQVASLHAIDVETSMLVAFAAHHPLLPGALQPKVTYSLLSLSPSTSADLAAPGGQPVPTANDPDHRAEIPHTEWDVAVITNVLHHVEDPQGFFVGLTQVIKKDGWVVIIEPSGLVPPSGDTYDVPPLAPGEVMSKEELDKLKQHGHAHSTWHTPEAIIQMMQQHGLTDIRQELHGSMPFQGVGQEEVRCLVIWGRAPGAAGPAQTV